MAGHCEEYINYIIKEALLDYIHWMAKDIIPINDINSLWTPEEWVDEFLAERKQNRVTEGVPL